MNKVKKIITIIIFTCSILFIYGCGFIDSKPLYKKKIVTTQYPQYEFVKALIGDSKQLSSSFEVSLLIPPGADSHSFDLRVEDLIEIKNSDLFLYTSDEIEKWVKKLDISKYTEVIDLSVGIELFPIEEEADHDHHHSEADHEYDPHYWLYPLNAVKMVETIRDLMIELVKDPECKKQLSSNAFEYIESLKQIDEDIKKVVAKSSTNKLYFGSPFSFYYWTREYGLEYVLTYATCSIEVEPSMNTIINVINDMKKENVKVIYVKELLSDRVAKMISEATGAEIVLLHSCENVSKDDFESGKSYLEIMNENVLALSKGLNVNYEEIKEGK